MNKYLALIGIACIGLAAQAQPLYNYAELDKTYKGHTLVVLNREQNLTIGMKKDKFDIESEHLTQVYHIDSKNIGYSERQVGYSPTFFTIKNLEARTFIPQGDGKYKKVEVTEFKDEGQVDLGSIFYDGYRYKKFTYASLTSGTISEMKYTYTYHDPSHLGGLYFYWGPPHLKVSYKITVSDEVKINYRFFGDSNLISHTVTREGKNTIHRWEAKNIPAIKSYNDAVNDRYFEPHLYVYIESYKTKDGWQPLFGTTAKLYNFSKKYIEKVNQKPISTNLKNVVDSIKNVSTAPDDVIRNVYYWVQQNMRYIAFEDGLGGQIPREANDIYEQRFGDCKDFASLITFMLKEANIPAYLTWIGTRDLPYDFDQLPLGYASNHMIAAVYRNNQWIFIDGTSKHTPYGSPSGFIQGKAALIAISPDSFVVVRVPIMKPHPILYTDSIYLTLDNGVLKGTDHAQYQGFQRSYLVGNLYYTGIDKLNDYLKLVVAMGNNKCEVTEVSASNYANNDSVLHIKGKFTLPDYAKSIDNDYYINLNLQKPYSGFKIDTLGARMASKELNYTSNETYTYVLEIPAGYKVKSIPNNANYTSPNFSYNITYVVNGNKITLKQHTIINTLEVKKADFNEWNKAIESLIKVYKEQLIISKNIK